MTNLNKQLENIAGRVGNLVNVFGTVNERLLRPAIERSFGRAFAKERTLYSLQCLSSLISKGSGVGIGSTPSQICDSAQKLAAYLEDNEIGWKMLIEFFDFATNHSFFRAFEKAATAADVGARIEETELLSEDDTVDDHEVINKFKIALRGNFESRSSTRAEDSMEDYRQNILCAVELSLGTLNFFEDQVINSIRERLRSLCYLLSTHYSRDRIQKLEACDGPGFMLAHYASRNEAMVRSKSLGQILPPDVCQMDVRGSITVIDKYGIVKVGEIKTSDAGKKKAKSQIVARTALITWAVKILCSNVTELILQGHIFMSKKMSTDRSRAAAHVSDVMSIFVHRL